MTQKQTKVIIIFRIVCTHCNKSLSSSNSSHPRYSITVTSSVNKLQKYYLWHLLNINSHSPWQSSLLMGNGYVCLMSHAITLLPQIISWHQRDSSRSTFIDLIYSSVPPHYALISSNTMIYSTFSYWWKFWFYPAFATTALECVSCISKSVYFRYLSLYIYINIIS